MAIHTMIIIVYKVGHFLCKIEYEQYSIMLLVLCEVDTGTNINGDICDGSAGFPMIEFFFFFLVPAILSVF